MLTVRGRVVRTAVARAARRLLPDEPPLVEVRVVEQEQLRVGSRPVGAPTERVVVRWIAP